MSTTTLERRRVRVWFGQHAIADQTKEAKEAAAYEEGMRRRFKGLRVTSEPVAWSNEAVSTT
jgi:predicted transcriptional regulator